MVDQMTINEEVRLALQYSRNYAVASAHNLTVTGKEHINGLCDLVEKLHKLLADKASAVVPDALKHEADDHPDAYFYVKGWNDFRHAMLKAKDAKP
jgi:hypothetical protein